MVSNMFDDDLAAQAQESRQQFIQVLREQNKQRQAELQRDMAEREAFAGPEPLPFRRRQTESERGRGIGTDCGCGLVYKTTEQPTGDAELDEHIQRIVDARIVHWLAQEGAETDRKIGEALRSIRKAFEDVDRALDRVGKRMVENLANAKVARDCAIAAAEARFEVKLAEMRGLIASNNATVIDGCTPLAPRRVN
jgi:hypothetical protein